MAKETPANSQQIQQILIQMEKSVNGPSFNTIETIDLLTDDADDAAKVSFYQIFSRHW